MKPNRNVGGQKIFYPHGYTPIAHCCSIERELSDIKISTINQTQPLGYLSETKKGKRKPKIKFQKCSGTCSKAS